MRRGFVPDKAKEVMEGVDMEKLKQAATEQESVALALSAFAVQAYLKSVLCPSLADFTPRAQMTPKVSQDSQRPFMHALYALQLCCC